MEQLRQRAVNAKSAIGEARAAGCATEEELEEGDDIGTLLLDAEYAFPNLEKRNALSAQGASGLPKGSLPRRLRGRPVPHSPCQQVHRHMNTGSCSRRDRGTAPLSVFS